MINIRMMIGVWNARSGTSNADLADDMGLSRDAINKIIKANNCNTDRLCEMAEFYGVGLIEFISEGV